MGDRELGKVREIALALQEVSERLSHGALCFFIRDRQPLCYYHDNHRGDGRVSVWFSAPPGVQDMLVDPNGGRFFRPPTSASGTFGNWVGVFLDMGGEDEVDWGELRMLIEDAYRMVAPKKVIDQLHGQP